MLAFEGSLTKSKESRNIFPNQIRTWVQSSPMTIRTTRRKTDREEPIYEVKDVPRIEITLADEMEALLTDTFDKRIRLNQKRYVRKRWTSDQRGRDDRNCGGQWEEGTTTEPTPEERVDTLRRKESITTTQERMPRGDTRPKEGWNRSQKR